MSVLLKNLYFNGKPANKVILNGEVIHTGANKLIFSVDTDSISFGKEGGVSSVTITANENWVMTVPSWLTASSTSGSSTTTVSISAGVATEGHSGNILITCSGKEHIITAEQVVVNYFRITNRTADSGTITLTKTGSPHDIVLRARTNGGEWSQPVTYSATSTISLPANGYVEFDGSANEYWSNSDSYRWKIQANVNHDVSGDIMTLISGSSLGAYEFISIFNGNINLANASGLTLSSTTLANNCYQQMFYGCTSLTTAPVLPATTLADGCYSYMFASCASLTTAPSLPATRLVNNCYYYMFNGCSSLTTTPVLPATTLAGSCYSNMFGGCTSLTTAPELPVTSLAYSCYSSMFNGCTSLTTTPVLPATTLANYCYLSMFQRCTSLTTVQSVLPATTLAQSCYSSMFNGCTSLTTAPVLPATTLAYGCYNSMFSGCTSLNYIKCLATNISASNCTSTWVSGVASTGTFVKAASMSSWTTGADGIPSNWTVEDNIDPGE